MKGEKEEMWVKAEHVGNPTAPVVGDMGARNVGGKGTIAVGSGGEPADTGLGEKPPATIGHDAAKPTLEGVGNKEPAAPKAGAGGGYKKDTGNTAAKLSPMAQKVGSPRKGY